MERASGERAAARARAEFRVGDFLVRPRLNQVVRPSGRVARVQPKIMEVLVVLAGRAGEVVTREEMFETVWEGTHVSEHALARAISALRKLFGDDRARPRFIETIPKTGYRLVAAVTDVQDSAREEAQDSAREEARDAEGGGVVESFAEGRQSSGGVGGFGLSRGGFRVGVAALSCAAVVVVLVILVILVTRDPGHAHLHLHH